jgi:CHAD domain-containing protein
MATSLGSDRAIHAARTNLKRARAALRLLRAGIGDTAYHRANARLRAAAQPLTAARDMAVLRLTLRVVTKANDSGEMRGYLKGVRQHLNAAHHAEVAGVTRQGNRRLAHRVQSVKHLLETQPMRRPDVRSARLGLKRIYKQGRAAFFRSQRHPQSATLHEWRKQAKYLANALTLVRESFGPGLDKVKRQADKLAATLGDDHDLALLHARVKELHGAGSLPDAGSSHKKLLRRIRLRQARLQAKARRLGDKLYQDLPSSFEAVLRRSILVNG